MGLTQGTIARSGRLSACDTSAVLLDRIRENEQAFPGHPRFDVILQQLLSP
jgi:hypothetical protein